VRKHNQIHTLGAPCYEAHFRFLRKLEDFKCALWSEKCGTNQSSQKNWEKQREGIENVPDGEGKDEFW